MKELIPSLVQLADHLDKKGFKKEADFADQIVRKIAEEVEEGKEDEKDGEMEEEGMMPAMMQEEPKCASTVVIKNAKENLEKVQLRIRARQRRLLTKQS